VHMSAASKSDAARAANQLAVSTSSEDGTTGLAIRVASFERYEWTKGVGEVGHAVALGGHFFNQLPEEVRSAIRLVDARSAKMQLIIPRSGREPQLDITGCSDACVQWKQHTPPRGTDQALNEGTLMLIDWKTPTAMGDHTKVASQLMLQLLSFWGMHKRSVPVVATDCSTAIRIWKLEGSALVEIGDGEGGANPLSLMQGINIVSNMLIEGAALSPARIAAAKKRILVTIAELDSEQDDTNDSGDDDDEGGGYEGGGSGHATTASASASSLRVLREVRDSNKATDSVRGAGATKHGSKRDTDLEALELRQYLRTIIRNSVGLGSEMENLGAML
jgi:hypothetical protein